MTHRSIRLACAAGLAAIAMLPGAAGAAPRAATANEDRPERLREVGHEPLMNRGMNAAIAVHGDYAYIGSRTDGSHVGQPQGGIMVVDISRPRRPELLTETPIDARRGESSRELRVWRVQGTLNVLHNNCRPRPALH